LARTRLPVVLDENASAYDTVFVSAGKRGTNVDLDPADPLKITVGTTASITR
jgi:Cys-tRNA(Pro)/Cys-tRNA(Cys) deacylase